METFNLLIFGISDILGYDFVGVAAIFIQAPKIPSSNLLICGVELTFILLSWVWYQRSLSAFRGGDGPCPIASSLIIWATKLVLQITDVFTRIW